MSGHYCWNVSRLAESGERSRAEPSRFRFVAQGRQPTLEDAKRVAELNHEEDCVTTVWQQVLRVEGAPPEPVHEYVNGRWRIRR